MNTEKNTPDRLYQDTDLVQFYDYDNPWSSSFDTMLNWVKETDTVLDLGCGTGTLTVALARKTQRVYGLDLSSTMLEVAQQKSQDITWITENSCTFSLEQQFDFIVLSGHSFQTLLTDEDRLLLFKNIKKHLKPEGTFVFDSRNPKVEEWKTWTPDESIRYFKHPKYDIIKAWNDWEVQSDWIKYHTFYQVLFTDQLWKAESIIAFPTKECILTLLQEAGLQVTESFGDWVLNEHTPTSEEMIFKGTHR